MYCDLPDDLRCLSCALPSGFYLVYIALLASDDYLGSGTG